MFKDMLLKLALELLERVLTPEMVNVVKAKAVAYLRDLAESTENELDDKIVDIVAKALGG